MKKLGFTLAEVLIAMAVIGVVAAISLPTLGVNARKKANLTTLRVTKADFETVFTDDGTVNSFNEEQP